MIVDVAVLTYRGVNAQAYACINDMLNYTKAQGHDVYTPGLVGSAIIHWSRNKMINGLRADADYVLLVDDDMAPRRDALVKLMAHDLPAVSAFCTTREEFPVRIAAQRYDRENDVFWQLERIRPGALLKGDFMVGTAFLLLKKEVIDRAIEWYLDAQDWLADNRKAFDRMHVRAEQREKERAYKSALRRAHYKKDGHHRAFDFAIIENQWQIGEDATFCRNLLRMGVSVALDSATTVAHIGWFPYSPANLDDKSAEDVLARVSEDREAAVA